MQGRKLRNKGFFTGMDVDNGAAAAWLQFFPLVTANLGS